MRVEEHEDRARCVPGSGRPRPDQSFPGRQSDELDQSVEVGLLKVFDDGQLTWAWDLKI